MKNLKITALIGIILLLFSIQTFATVNVVVNSNGLRYTSVLLNGSTSAKYDIVFVGDGFTSSTTDQNKFNTAVETAIEALRHKHPYMDNMCAFNVWRVNVISTETGIDHPAAGVSKNTELDCTFGDGVNSATRAIFSTNPSKVTEAANFAPAHDAIYVLVNDTEYGGAAGDIVYTSLNTSMSEVIVHELGHFVGHLADEYTCYFCDGRVEPPYSGPEPSPANVTIQTNRNLVKWKSFINSTTLVPTTTDSPVGVVGLWAGGNYSPTGVYRPQSNCLMKSLNNELCKVCNKELSTILNPYCTVCDRNPSSIACIISRIRDIVLVRKPTIFRIPECCFCPLDIFNRTEIELSINPEIYSIAIKDGNSKAVESKISRSDRGTVIRFNENSNTKYYLSIAPRSDQKELSIARISVKLSRNGQNCVLF